MPVKVKVRGLAELQAALPRFANRVDQQMTQTERWAADQAAQKARSNVPRRTGYLAASTSASGHTASMDAPYATFVEFGGRGHPHTSSGNVLGPAAEETEPVYQQRAELDTNNVIRGFSWPRQ